MVTPPVRSPHHYGHPCSVPNCIPRCKLAPCNRVISPLRSLLPSPVGDRIREVTLYNYSERLIETSLLLILQWGVSCMGTLMFWGCVFLCKCAPVLTLDVLQIAEDQTYVAWLTNLAKAGYFSAVLSLIQKSTAPASCFCASRSHSCNRIHPKHPPPMQLAGSRPLVDQQWEGGLITKSNIAAMLWNWGNRSWNWSANWLIVG